MCEMLRGVLGIGVDLCEIARIERAMQRPRFLKRICTEGERAYLSARGKGEVQSAAAMFAAKEAVAKALGTGFTGGISFEQIEVTHGSGGAPGIVLHGAAKARMQHMGASRVLISLSHEGNMAAAFAMIVVD